MLNHVRFERAKKPSQKISQGYAWGSNTGNYELFIKHYDEKI